MAFRSRCTNIPLSLFATPVWQAISNKYLIYFIYLIITNYFYTRTVHTAQVCRWNCNRTAKKIFNNEDKTLVIGLRRFCPARKDGVKAGSNISTSNNFFSLFCPPGSDREVTGVISVHAQYRCNEPFIAIYEHVLCMYGAPYVMLLMRANPLWGQVERGWALVIMTFFVRCEMAWSRHASAIWGPKKLSFPRPKPLPLAQVMDFHATKASHTGPYQS
jgi:hypothetical protein